MKQQYFASKQTIRAAITRTKLMIERLEKAPPDPQLNQMLVNEYKALKKLHEASWYAK